MHIAGHDKPTGAMLENLVLSDLLAWRDGSSHRAELYFWRTHAGEEIDFVIEQGSTLLHTGNTIDWLAPRIVAVPWWRVV